MPNPAQTKPKAKKGAITQDTIASPDVLASSNVLLNPTRPGAGQRGLQQFFTPPVVAEFADAIFGLNQSHTFDPTAGDGALLTQTSPELRFGVEIDPEHTKAANYSALQGDIQRYYPLFRATNTTFPRIVANPPFGIDDWSDPVLTGGKKANSTLLTFRYCMGLLEADGAGLFVAGRDRFNKLILAGDPLDSQAIAVQIDVADLFPDVSLPCTVAFFVQPTNRTERDLAHFTASATDFSDSEFRAKIKQAFKDRVQYVARPIPALNERTSLAYQDKFAVLQTEYQRRLEEADLTQQYDLQIKNNKLSFKLSSFAQLALAAENYALTRSLQALHGQSPAYFAINLRQWHQLNRLADAGVLTIDPQAHAHIERLLAKTLLQMRPMYPIAPQMRLGFLDDIDKIQCIKSDTDKGFRKNENYSVRVDSQVQREVEERLHEPRHGEPQIRRFEKEKKVLRITIDGKHFTESPDDLNYILDHFALPEVGDLEQDHPAELAEARQILDQIAAENGFTWEDFQREDLARCVLKERVLIAWAMGAGKTLGLLGTSEALIRTKRAKNQVLIIAPQDLHDQWRREAKKFLGTTGRDLKSINSPAEARQVARHLKRGGEGWYLISYEALSITGTKGTKLRPSAVINSETTDPDEEPSSRLSKTTAEACPSCSESITDGWSGTYCQACNYSHYEVRVKNAASHLSTAFKNGIIAVDELSMVRGDSSQRSLALRGLRSRCRLAASGTPISNYVNDIFWGIAWTIGFATSRFPYDYTGGKTKFEKDFCVIEYQMGDKDKGEAHRRQRRKVLPEVTNLSMLWRLLSLNMVRRRQQDMGEMVERTFHAVEVPMGTNQEQMHNAWLSGFTRWFAQKYPTHPLLAHNMVERYQATLGLLWKLEYSATLPAADPDLDWIRTEGKRKDGADEPIAPSNWTPKLLKTLETIEKHVVAEEKVLVASALVDTGPLIADLLQKRGIRAAHIADIAGDGKAKTKSPKKRAQAVTDFVTGNTQVLCVGVNAMKLGHNLDVASAVVLAGMPWSHEAFEQILARVWRRTSKKPVSVYCMITKGSLDERKFQLLSDKAAASDVALDGRLIEEKEEPHNWNKYLRELQAAGLTNSGDTLPEDSLEKLWHSKPLPRLRSLYTNSLKDKTAASKHVAGVPSPVYKLATKPGEQSSFFD